LTARTVVVGGGVMGSSAAWQLASRGHDVTLLEQFQPGHDRGSSHGSSRIFRLAYPDPFYVDLAARALGLWRQLEADTGSPVLTLTGAVDHGPPSSIGPVAEALVAAGHRAEFLSPAQAAERWPGLRVDTGAVYHAEGGRLHADHAVRALQQAATRRGAEVRHGARAATISARSDGRVEVVTADEQSFVADRVVVAVGGWAPRTLAGLVEGLPRMRVTQEQPAHFPAENPLGWPSFIHHGPATLLPGIDVYGLGSVDGVKVGFHGVGPLVTDPTDRDRSIDLAAQRRLQEYASAWLPGVDPERPESTTCLYTTTPDHDFVIDRQGPIVVLAGFSGHGFKFGSLIGELAADLADDRPGLSRFALRRAAR